MKQDCLNELSESGVFAIETLNQMTLEERTRVALAVRELFKTVGWSGTNPDKWGLLADPTLDNAVAPAPLTLVALDSDRNVLGSASVIEHDREDLQQYRWWLAGVIVREDMRQLGLGTLLVEECEKHARATLFNNEPGYMYLDTERNIFRTDQPEWYQRRGWVLVDATDKALREKIVMRKWFEAEQALPPVVVIEGENLLIEIRQVGDHFAIQSTNRKALEDLLKLLGSEDPVEILVQNADCFNTSLTEKALQNLLLADAIEGDKDDPDRQE
jgi:GNAT superfamily N-acetyltransferase